MSEPIRRVLLVRHARTSWNAEGRYQGQADPPLDKVGMAQAYQLAALIAEIGPSVVQTSDLQRAVQTAQAVGAAAAVPVTADARLRERSLGHWEGLNRDEVAARYPAEFADWVAGRDVTGRGGESREEVASRARAAFDELPEVEVAVLVTHSATAMALCADVLGLSQREHILAPLANCHWTELRMEPARTGAAWRLRAHNVGAPGPVIPVLTRRDASDDDAADARA